MRPLLEIIKLRALQDYSVADYKPSTPGSGFVDNFLQSVLDNIYAIYKKYAWGRDSPHDHWHCWDSKPWQHPWLTHQNLREMREFSDAQIVLARRYSEKYRDSSLRVAAVCNMANNIYQRATGVEALGVDIDVYQHPQDNHIMSFPAWEEYNGIVDGNNLSFGAIRNSLPFVSMSKQTSSSDRCNFSDLEWLRCKDVVRWPDYISYNANLFRKLKDYDVLWATQAPYLAYLSSKPYIATQSGGDAWFECARGDSLGVLQRTAFGSASAFFANNPWSFGFARQYGWRNLLYLPLYMNENRYSPGGSLLRKQWVEQSGGNFFILATSRLDKHFKGNTAFLSVFKDLLVKYPGIRLVTVCWGDEVKSYKELLSKYGLDGYAILLPLSGKRRLVEYLRSADCLIDQFKIGYLGATAIEAMGCGLPVIMRLERAQYKAMMNDQVVPILDADNPSSIYSHIARLIDNPEYKHEVSISHRDWFLKNHSEKVWAPIYRDMLLAVANGFSFDFSHSPLNQELSLDEVSYRVDRLSSAPKFPSYDIS